MIATLLMLLAASADDAAHYDTHLTRAVAACEAIDPDAYQSGLWLNPDGYSSFYERSSCYQRRAVEFRQPALCEQVEERWSLFSSSWGISQENCEKLVAEKVANDREELLHIKARYQAGRVQLESVKVARNGNGRDYDFLPAFSGEHSGEYHLVFEVIDDGRVYRVLERSGHVAGDSNLRLYLPVVDLRSRYPAFEPGKPVRLRATMMLSVGMQKTNGWVTPTMLREVFPPGQRQQQLEAEVSF